MSKKAEKLIKYLPKVRSNTTYGEVAKKLHTVPMAVGQMIKSIHKNHPELRKYTKRVKSAA
jgi:hypothetical protein